MAENTLHVEVVTPNGEVAIDDVTMVVLPGVEGEIGVLARHEPLVTLLAVGETRLQRPDTTWIHIASGTGYAQVLFDTVFVVVDHAEMAADIDLARAEEALARSREILKLRSDPGAQAEYDFVRAELAMKRAENRVKVAARRAGA